MSRAVDAGLVGHLVTGGSLSDSKEALKITRERSDCFSTCGVHPTRCDELENSENQENYYQQLVEVAKDGKVLAIGECGLDYDRLHFCSRPVQLKWFERQLNISMQLNKPLFLHLREYSGMAFLPYILILHDTSNE